MLEIFREIINLLADRQRARFANKYMKLSQVSAPHIHNGTGPEINQTQLIYFKLWICLALGCSFGIVVIECYKKRWKHVVYVHWAVRRKQFISQYRFDICAHAWCWDEGQIPAPHQNIRGCSQLASPLECNLGIPWGFDGGGPLVHQRLRIRNISRSGKACQSSDWDMSAGSRGPEPICRSEVTRNHYLVAQK